VGAAEAAVCGLLNAAVLTLLVCTAVAMARRAPVAWGAAARAARRHLRAALLLGAAVVLERTACLLPWGTPARLFATPAALGGIALDAARWAAVFAAVSLVAHAVEHARRARAGEAAGLALQASLARAELERTSAELRGLQLQVNPGFLYTALGAVASRMHDRPAEAERMVVRLADLLRRAMGGAGEEEVPLEEEVRALEPFLEVERIRLGGRLRTEWEVDDDALDALVPRSLLQPLAADAVARAEGGEGAARMTIAARRTGDWLELEVRGGAPAPPDAPGEGAAGARARLARMYGDGCSVEGGGARTVLRLPWHEEPWR
jgi:hypothetical protein